MELLMNKNDKKDIRVIINKIGNEIDNVLTKKQTKEYLYLIMLLYNLIENFLKWLIATKILWDETIKQTDAELQENKYKVDFEIIKQKVKKLTFYSAIEQAKELNLIGIGLE